MLASGFVVNKICETTISSHVLLTIHCNQSILWRIVRRVNLTISLRSKEKEEDISMMGDFS